MPIFLNVAPFSRPRGPFARHIPGTFHGSKAHRHGAVHDARSSGRCRSRPARQQKALACPGHAPRRARRRRPAARQFPVLDPSHSPPLSLPKTDPRACSDAYVPPEQANPSPAKAPPATYAPTPAACAASAPEAAAQPWPQSSRKPADQPYRPALQTRVALARLAWPDQRQGTVSLAASRHRTLASRSRSIQSRHFVHLLSHDRSSLHLSPLDVYKVYHTI
jgi:hypothetical protein